MTFRFETNALPYPVHELVAGLEYAVWRALEGEARFRVEPTTVAAELRALAARVEEVTPHG